MPMESLDLQHHPSEGEQAKNPRSFRVEPGARGPVESAAHLTLAAAVERLERQMIGDALREADGNLARASRSLGTTERILRYKAGKYGITSGRRSRAPRSPRT
jgi:transcriptional regulator with GAF, ATPase, and Fis domain